METLPENVQEFLSKNIVISEELIKNVKFETDLVGDIERWSRSGSINMDVYHFCRSDTIGHYNETDPETEIANMCMGRNAVEWKIVEGFNKRIQLIGYVGTFVAPAAGKSATVSLFMTFRHKTEFDILAQMIGVSPKSKEIEYLKERLEKNPHVHGWR